MLKKYDFFDISKNKTGHGFDNQYQVQNMSFENDKIVIDIASGLMWHQSGSSEYMEFEDAKKWIAELNQGKFAGFNDW